MAAARGDQHHEATRSLISMRELLDQVNTNKKHFMRSSKSLPELPTTVANGSPLALAVRTYLPPVRELDNDPDTFMFVCLPCSVITLQGLWRKIWRCISNLVWTRPPLPCVTTTCGPIHHVRSCEFHALSRSGALPYNIPIRRSTLLSSVKVQRSQSLPDNLRSSSSLPAPSSSTSASTSASGSASTSPSTSSPASSTDGS